MGTAITRAAALLAILAAVSLASAATFTPPATAPTPDTSPTVMASPTTLVQSSATVAPSPRLTLRRTPSATASPEAAADAEPTPLIPDAQGDEASDGGMPSAGSLPSNAPLGAGRGFRTPGREAPPAFVQPQVEPPTDADDAQPDAGADAVPPDRPYVATITFHVAASTDLDSFDLNVIYPLDAGQFVRSGVGADCRKTVDAMMFADDRTDGSLRLVVGGNRPLTFPLDIACRFTVAPNTVLNARLIAVNVLEVTSGNKVGDPSELTVSVSAQ